MEDRKVIFDISCRCKDGKTFIIEMQKGYQKYFRERALYYTTYPINAQGREARDRHEADRLAGKFQEKFKWDYNLKPVIVVALLNFEFKHWDNWPDEKYLSSYRLLEDATHEPMTNTLRFVFLELGRFKKSVSELNTAFEKWVYLLKNMQNMKQIPPEFNDPLFKRLFLLAEIGKFTPQELEQYYKSLNNMGDYDNIISTAKEEAERIGRELGLKLGLEQGLEQGRTEGRAKAQLEIARKMLESGMPADQIAQFTGISVEELAAM